MNAKKQTLGRKQIHTRTPKLFGGYLCQYILLGHYHLNKPHSYAIHKQTKILTWGCCEKQTSIYENKIYLLFIIYFGNEAQMRCF
jgi:hypothetical protein